MSFISLSKILPAAFDLMYDNSEMVCLIKPQFEAGKGKVGKKGVVRDPKIHLEVIINTFGYAISCGFEICGISFSPIRGPEGNIEYLLHLKKIGKNNNENGKLNEIEEKNENDKVNVIEDDYVNDKQLQNIRKVVKEAHAYFSNNSK